MSWPRPLGHFLLLAALALLLPGRHFLPADALWVDILTGFAPQYALAAVLLALAAMWRRRWLRALPFLLLLLPDGYSALRGGAVDGAAGAPEEGLALTVYAANLFESDRAVRAAVRQVEALDPDIIWWSEFPTELDPDTYALVAELGARYPFGFEMEAYDSRELRFLSRFPLRSRQMFEPPRTRGRPALRLGLDVQGTPLVVFALHTHPPTSPWSLTARNQTLDWVERHLAHYGGNALVMGDLNTAAHAPRFRQFVQRSGLQCRSPWRCTVLSWPSFFPPLLTSIDHVLGKGHLTITDLRRGPFTGSDHFPVIAEVLLH